jgi:hypothetical protein
MPGERETTLAAEDAALVERPGAAGTPVDPQVPPAGPREIGGPKGPEPTRYGDWERSGRCIDF